MNNLPTEIVCHILTFLKIRTNIVPVLSKKYNKIFNTEFDALIGKRTRFRYSNEGACLILYFRNPNFAIVKFLNLNRVHKIIHDIDPYTEMHIKNAYFLVVKDKVLDLGFDYRFCYPRYLPLSRGTWGVREKWADDYVGYKYKIGDFRINTILHLLDPNTKFYHEKDEGIINIVQLPIDTFFKKLHNWKNKKYWDPLYKIKNEDYDSAERISVPLIS